MADRKITDLSAQTSLTGTDLMMLVRSGANYKITVANMITSIVADHLADTADAHDASAISVLDTGGNFTGTNVETVLDELFDAIGAGTELAYVEFTSSVAITATAEATPNDVVSAGAVAFDGSTRVCIEFYSARVDIGTTANSTTIINLWEDSTNLGRLALVLGGTQAAAHQVLARRFLTPTAGTKTYKVAAWRVASDGAVQGGSGGTDELPGYIRITTA